MLPENSKIDPTSFRIREQLEELRQGYVNTGNPTFAWQALKFSYAGYTALRRAAGESLSPDPVPPPQWCMGYLLKCAENVEHLIWGIPLRLAPGQDCPDVFSYDRLTEPQRIEALAFAFGFTRSGWNAFTERATMNRTHGMLQHYEDLRATGVSAADAENKVMDKYGFEDERSVRRRLAKFRSTFSAKCKTPTKNRTKPGP